MGKRAAAVAVAASSSRTKTQDADVVVYPDEEDDDALVVVLPPPLLKKKKREEEDTSPSLCPVSAPNAAVVVSDEKETTTDESLFLSSSSSSSATELSDLITANNHTTAQEVVVESQQPRQPPLSSKAGVSIVVEAGHLHYDRQNKFNRERPARITAILNALQNDKDVWDRCSHMNILKDEDDPDSAQKQPPLSSSYLGRCLLDDDQDYLRRVHAPGYLQRLEKISSSAARCGCCSCSSGSSNQNKDGDDCCVLDREAEQYTSIFLSRHSVSEAQKAVRALCLLTERVVLENRMYRHQQHAMHNSEGIGNCGGDGFAIIRPPGHHAEPSLAGGYCLYNNVGVAASYAHHKLNCRKILILDWDVHHGNGTERMFWNDPNILYFSVHRYDGGAFYPGTGSPQAVGGTEAQGRTINVGWSQPHMGDAEYVAVWKYVLLPVLAEFDPDLVLVSAGFDAADGDELGGCHVTPRGFGRLTRLLKRQLRDVSSLRRSNNASIKKEYNKEAASTRTRSYPAPVVCALEGGYARSVMGQCVVEVVRALLDENDKKNANDYNDDYSMDDATLDSIHPAAARNIRQTLQAQAPYWTCLQELVS